MSTWNILTYAVSGLDVSISDVTRTFVSHIIGKFPKNTFKPGSVYIDTMGLIDDHKRREEGLQNPSKVVKPYLTVSINGGLTDQWSSEDNGPLTKQFSMFPGTTTDRRLVNNHRLGVIVDDDIGIRLDTIEIRRKLDLNFKFEFNTKSDLNTAKSYIYNTMALKKANYLNNVRHRIILPNSMVNDISRLAFDQSQFDLSNQLDLDKLLNYLNDKGYFHFCQKVEDVNDANIWYTMDRFFHLNYMINELDGKDGEGAEKNGDAYDKFSLEMNCTLDFKMPNSYVLNYKVFNGPNKTIVNSEYFKTVELDEMGNCPITHTEPKFIEDRESIVPPSTQKHRLIVREEFFVENATEYLQVSHFIPYGSVYWLLIERATPKERAGIFEMHVYENTTFIGRDSYTMEDCGSDIICHIRECDTKVSFMMFLYCDLVALSRLLPILTDRVYKGIYPNVGPDGLPLIVGSYPPSTDPNSVTSYGSGGYSFIGLGGDFAIGGNNITGRSGDITNNSRSLDAIESYYANITAMRS